MKIKTRFAPSPTGYLHIGGIRTALYAWLYARNLGGEFILRIEDTDLGRSSQKYIDAIIDGMKWLNLSWDAGPYFQTKRFDRYRSVINDMLRNGHAYHCYCSKNRLYELRNYQITKGEKPRYDGWCRNSFNNKDALDKSSVIRFNNPQDGSVIFNDLIRGCIEFKNKELDDFIICRADGTPTYNFCVVVDDYDMAISHVIRGEDHINNTPRQINLFKAIGAEAPCYAHVSMIIGEDGKKLCKRHGTISVMQYRNDGFLPEALLNYLVRMGWSHGDQEIFSINEMIQLFSLDSVGKSASKFNLKKLLWLNQYYINHLSADDVAKELFWHLKHQGIDTNNGPDLTKIVKLFNNKCKTIKEIANRCQYFYENFDTFDTYAAQKYLKQDAIKPLELMLSKLTNLSVWTSEMIHNAIVSTSKALAISIEKVSMPLRVAITGVSCSPSIDLTIYTIGRQKTLMRIHIAIAFIVKNKINI